MYDQATIVKLMQHVKKHHGKATERVIASSAGVSQTTIRNIMFDLGLKGIDRVEMRGRKMQSDFFNVFERENWLV